jgi:hypothetical protein
MKNWLLSWLAVIMSALLGVGLKTASAHQPTFNSEGSPTPESAFVIEDIGLSLALFGNLQEAGSVDYYRLDAPASHDMEFKLFVPVACETFRPQMALIGPEVSGSSPPLKLELPSGMGVDAIALEQWGTFFEPFDPSFYFAGPTIDHVAEGGTYFIAVYSTQDQSGAYMLGMSGREEFSAGENWREQKSAYDRCEVGANNWFWRQWRIFAAGGVLSFVPLVGGVALLRRRRI